MDETRGIIAGKVVKAVEQRASNVCDMEEQTSALHLSGIHFNPNMPICLITFIENVPFAAVVDFIIV